jgi:hypothetical protein
VSSEVGLELPKLIIRSSIVGDCGGEDGGLEATFGESGGLRPVVATFLPSTGSMELWAMERLVPENFGLFAFSLLIGGDAPG